MNAKKIQISKSTYDDFRYTYVEFAKETKNFVILANGNRLAKDTEYYKMFDSFEDAKRFVITIYAKKIIALRREAESLQTKIFQLHETFES